MPFAYPFLQRGDGLALDAALFQIPHLEEVEETTGVRETDQRADAHQDEPHACDVAHRTPFART
jgi:hypothetical protein